MRQVFILFHVEHGLYVGYCMGGYWWSLLDRPAYAAISTFATERALDEFLEDWPAEFKAGCRKGVVTVWHPSCVATLGDLRAAGFASMTAGMEAEYLKYAEPWGRC